MPPETSSPEALRRSRWYAAGCGLLGAAFIGLGVWLVAGAFGPAAGIGYLALAAAIAFLTRDGSMWGVRLLFGWLAFGIVWSVAGRVGAHAHGAVSPALRTIMATRRIPLEATIGLVWCVLGVVWGGRLWRGEPLRSSPALSR